MNNSLSNKHQETLANLFEYIQRLSLLKNFISSANQHLWI